MSTYIICLVKIINFPKMKLYWFNRMFMILLVTSDDWIGLDSVLHDIFWTKVRELKWRRLGWVVDVFLYINIIVDGKKHLLTKIFRGACRIFRCSKSFRIKLLLATLFISAISRLWSLDEIFFFYEQFFLEYYFRKSYSNWKS